MHKIRILPSYIIDSIAAGEVIERPYSIVKELLENSIDADSKHIEIHIDNEEEIKMTISDDGMGINEHDLKLCVKRHATSKIFNNDLSQIDTLGFRGEALYAIASVSRLEIVSKTLNMDNAIKMIVEENKVLEVKPAKGKNGTTITVRNLFENFPVRKKFLSNSKGEYYYIREVIKSIAISHPEISFNYYENKRPKFILKTRTGENFLQNRLLDILGREFFESSLYLEEKKSFFSIKGYISIPTFNKSSWKDSIIIVNNRVIKDRKILGLIKAAYSGLLPGNRFPVVVLNLILAYDEIDVNVHPRKTEVGFFDRKKISSILIKVLRSRLNSVGLVNSGVYEKKLLSSFYPQEKKVIEKKLGLFSKDNVIHNYNLIQPKEKKSLDNENILEDYRLGNAVAQINNMFVVSQTKNKIILVDQHAAHERIVLEKLKKSYLKNNIERQILLMPEVLELDGNIRLFLDNMEKINKLGIVFEEYGENSLLVRELPGILGKVSIKELFDDLYLQLEKFDEVNLNNYQIEKLFSSIACHNSIRAGRKLNLEEMNNLLRLMENTPNSGQCNHGRPTFVELNIKDIEKLFGRT
ncbi:DNA mismatch repair endonuclease MutL [Alphaproteobacteria bacterium]|nr:DNA mismatch repair endonuclease MutL [Alphaproteobacteria bacterium]